MEKSPKMSLPQQQVKHTFSSTALLSCLRRRQEEVL